MAIIVPKPTSRVFPVLRYDMATVTDNGSLVALVDNGDGSFTITVDNSVIGGLPLEGVTLAWRMRTPKGVAITPDERVAGYFIAMATPQVPAYNSGSRIWVGMADAADPGDVVDNGYLGQEFDDAAGEVFCYSANGGLSVGTTKYTNVDGTCAGIGTYNSGAVDPERGKLRLGTGRGGGVLSDGTLGGNTSYSINDSTGWAETYFMVSICRLAGATGNATFTVRPSYITTEPTPTALPEVF